MTPEQFEIEKSMIIAIYMLNTEITFEEAEKLATIELLEDLNN